MSLFVSGLIAGVMISAVAALVWMGWRRRRDSLLLVALTLAAYGVIPESDLAEAIPEEVWQALAELGFVRTDAGGLNATRAGLAFLRARVAEEAAGFVPDPDPLT